MQRLEVSGAVRPLEWSLGVKGLREECSRIIAITRFHRLSLCSVHGVPALFAENNQQDAIFHNLFISVRRSTCFRRFFRPSSGDQNCT